MRVPKILEVWKMGVVNYLDALKLQENLVTRRKSELQRIGAELYYTQRGGDITFHGPHQPILYPIVSLRELGLGARKYVENLEMTMIKVSSLYGVSACPGQSGETGVWVGDKKIGAIGVRISGGITCHGLAYNVDPDLDYFKNIVPCGIADKEVTSLKREAEVDLPDEGVIEEELISCFVQQFGYDKVVIKESLLK